MVKPTLYQRIRNASLFFQILYCLCYTQWMARLSPRANTTDKLAPELEALPALGQTANINMEQLLGLKPICIGFENQHKNMNPNYNLTIFQQCFLITMASR